MRTAILAGGLRSPAPPFGYVEDGYKVIFIYVNIVLWRQARQRMEQKTKNHQRELSKSHVAKETNTKCSENGDAKEIKTIFCVLKKLLLSSSFLYLFLLPDGI